MPAVSDQFDLGFSISFDDLYSREGLLRLDRRFCEHLEASDCALHARLLAARANPAALAPLDQSELIIALAPLVEDFIGELFGIVPEIQALQVRHNQFAPFFSFKRKFIQKRAISGVTRDQAAAIDGPALRRELETRFGEPVTERSFFTHVSKWLDNETENADAIQAALRYAAWAALSPEGMKLNHGGTLFKVAHKLDPMRLIQLEPVSNGSSGI